MRDDSIDRSDPRIFARNVNAARRMFGWSTRELARRSGVAAKTIERIEAGGPCHSLTEDKLAEAVQAFSGRLWEPSFVVSESERVINTETAKWYFSDTDEARVWHDRMVRAGSLPKDSRFRMDPDLIQDEQERYRIGRVGLATGFVQVHTGVMNSGHYQGSLYEPFKRDSTLQSLHQCTSLFVVVRGKIRFEAPLGVHELSEGSSLAFETSKDVLHIEPSSPIGFDGVPPRVMIVRLGMIELKTRRGRGEAG